MLNLLPSSRKQALRHRYIMQQVRFLIGVAVVATSISVLMLFASDGLLQRWLRDITVETKSDIISTEERKNLQALVSEVVKLVNQAQPVAENQVLPLQDVVTLLGPTPDNIRLHEYSLDYVKHDLLVTGTADTREALVSYQQVVSDIPGVQTVHLPLNDITSKENISFTLQATYETAPVDTIE